MSILKSIWHNRPLSKLAYEDRMQGDLGAQNRSVLRVREDSSTKSTQQSASEVEFRNRSQRSFRLKEFTAFTLVEVMVAMAIMALSLLVLFQIQARSIRLADKARQLTTAVGLAKSKLYDCKYELLKRGLGISDFHETGKFEDPAFADYTWECQSHKFNMAMPDVQQLSADATKKTDKLNIPGMDLSAAAIGPFLSMIAEPLKDAIRELVVTLRWKNGDVNEEMDVATHVVDPKALSILLQSLPGGSGDINAAQNPQGQNPSGTPGGQPNDQPTAQGQNPLAGGGR